MAASGTFLPNSEMVIFEFRYGLRARVKIASHFKRRFISPGCVAKAWNMPDIPALSRLARQAPQH